MNLWAFLLQRPLIELLGPAPRQIARQRYQHDLSVSLGAAAGFHLVVLLVAMWLGLNGGEIEPPVTTWHFHPRPGPTYEPEDSPSPPPRPRPPRPTPPKLPKVGLYVPVNEPVRDDPPDTTSNNDPLPDIVDRVPWIEGDPGNGNGGRGRGEGNGTGGDGVDDGAPGDGYPSMDAPIIAEVMPELVEQPLPEYPEFAKLARIEGRVIVRVLLGKDGRVKKAVLIQGTNPLLDDAALDAAKRAIYKPALQQGHPVAVWMTIPFRFSLRDDRLR